MMIRQMLLATLVLVLGVPGAWAQDLSKIQWETNLDDPPIGDPGAKKGGVFHYWMSSYPLTFRLQGPDSNDSFAGWNRSFTMDFTLVRMHPTTDNYIPCLATHWSVQPDHRTIYYKLDPDARWSDGEKITADDFVFTNEMMRSPYIVDPFYNNYFEEHFESVEALDPYTLKVVGKYESWRPLSDFALWPMPRHAITLDENWVKESNLKFQIGAGPYVITDVQEGQSVIFERIKNWWGEKKKYFEGMYNVDRIELMVVLDSDRAFDHFQKGNISYYRVNTAKKWAQDMDFEAIQKGWAHKKRLFVDYPQGLYGFAMNLEKPIFQNKDFRKAIQYAFDFDEINKELMFGAYYRIVSAFEGTEYENHDLRPYGFNPKKVREHLAAAGYHKRVNGIFVKDDGSRASFTLTYGNSGLSRHFTVIKQKFQSLGIEMKLQELEPGTAFQRGLEREYEMTVMSRTSGFWPSPHQYFDSEFKKTKNNNNIWYFGTAKTDSLIDVYRFNMDFDKRVQAMHELDAIIQDAAFYVPFWQAPFVRFVYWDYLKFPEFFFPKRFEQITDWQVFWIDPDAQAQLAQAMKTGKSLTPDTVVDEDPYHVKLAMEKAMGSLED
jgi:microcin C transport system substrate-binding protein